MCHKLVSEDVTQKVTHAEEAWKRLVRWEESVVWGGALNTGGCDVNESSQGGWVVGKKNM